jgi:Glycoside hydrolase family 2 C-terminal domain 5/Domain of unknown function (DUF4982)/F5/8 type C domain/Glycosyl hydrolases family 2/Glycosyl hydrolases family 2, TIM barrel domain
VTAALNASGPNVVVVKVNNTQPSSRWYSGSGIYRHVWLSFVDPVHIKPWGIFVFTANVLDAVATVGAEVSVQNTLASSQPVTVTMTLMDDAGTVLSSLVQSATLEAGAETKLTFTHAVQQPRLWTVDQPVLHAAATELAVDGVVVETQRTSFGIRTIAFDAQQGFSLNSQPMKLHGLCMHHDLGALGAAINEVAIERQLRILKDMGANAIRTSHNPPAPELLDACIYHAPVNQNLLTSADLQCSSYDNSVVPWGTSAEVAWQADRDNAYVGGQFIWTGFDYLGEPTPYDWPAKSSYFGIVDTAGFAKDIYYFYLSQWSTTPTLHLLPHWNWPAGSTVAVMAYTNAESVELIVNGRSLGSQNLQANGEMKLVWQVPFEAGVLQAVGKKGGVVIATDQVTTAGAQASIALKSARTALVAGTADLLFVEVDVVDGASVVVPGADSWMRFTVAGGVVQAVDNGNPIDLDPYQATERRAFSGKALAVVRTPAQPGDVIVRATGFAGDKDLARGKTATADSTSLGRAASGAVDGDFTTAWCAADGATGHSWRVDLGSAWFLAGTQIAWDTPASSYKYFIETSADGVAWSMAVDNRSNRRAAQTQVDFFGAQARYVRVTITGTPSGGPACIQDFRAFGDDAVLSSNALIVPAR